jgi:hypothetical protein
MHHQIYRLGEVPKWVMTTEGGASYIDTENGRYWLKPGDTIVYGLDWTPIDVIRKGVVKP